MNYNDHNSPHIHVEYQDCEAIMRKLLLHVISAEYLDNYQLKLTFNNGIEGIVDLEQELYGEIFEPLKDKSLFQQAFVTSRTIEWSNGADFAPEFLFEIAFNKHSVSAIADQIVKQKYLFP